MRIHIRTKNDTVDGSGRSLLPLYSWDPDWKDDREQFDEVLSTAFQDFPGQLVGNVTHALIEIAKSQWTRLHLRHLVMKDGVLHLCPGCGRTLDTIESTFCSDYCKIRHTHSV